MTANAQLSGIPRGPQESTATVYVSFTPLSDDFRFPDSEAESVAYLGPERPLRLPTNWDYRSLDILFDRDAIRAEVVELQERVAQTRQRMGGPTFDSLFRTADNYSLWWTHVGCLRNPQGKQCEVLKQLSCLRQIINRFQPSRIVVLDGSKLLMKCLAHSEEASLFGLTRLSAPPSVGWAWCLRSLARVCSQPFLGLAQSVAIRLRAPKPRADDDSPKVVFSWRNSHYLEMRDGQFTFPFWQDVCAAFQASHGLTPRYLFRGWSNLRGHRLAGWWHTCWDRWQQQANTLSLPEQSWGVLAWLRALPAQLKVIKQYPGWEPHLIQQMSLAGFCVFPLYGTMLREAICGVTRWSRQVAGIEDSLRRAGNVRAMLVAEEFYKKAMPDLAAAQRLGIPTVGIQHGTISEAHWIYSPPQAQLKHTPSPDRFAAYNEFTQSILCELGDYAAEKVWVVGAPRFDRLRSVASRQVPARQELDIPADTKVFLLTLQTYPWYDQVVRSLFLALKDSPDSWVCVKCHPKRRGLRESEIRQLAEETNFDRFRVYQDSFEQLLSACDVLISTSSTTILEAILAERDAICVNLSNEGEYYPYVSHGGATGADSLDSLRQAIEHVTSGTPRQPSEAFLNLHARPSLDGGSASRLADRVYELVASSHSTTRTTRPAID